MPFKPNYRQQRSERNRVKEQRKQEKLQKQQELVEKRKAARQPEPPSSEPQESWSLRRLACAVMAQRRDCSRASSAAA
jgi:hypothetical protein